MNTSKARKSQQDSSSLVIGVEFDREKMTAALVDNRARIIAEQETETPQRTTRAAVAAITKLILSLAEADGRGNGTIRAIGISVPGLIDPATERVSIPGLKGWTRVAMRQMIEEGLSDSGHDIRTPKNEKRARAQHVVSSHPAIVIQSQPACGAAAESWSGAARGKSNVVYFSIGDEIAAGIVADGKVVRGSSGLAGSAGWLGLNEHFKGEYESRGCLAAEATIVSLTRRAIEGWSGGSDTMLGKLIKADPAQMDALTIIRAARGGDALAVRVVNETCRWIGRGIANLISILDPDALVIGGSLGLSLKPYIDEIRDEARRWMPHEISKHCRIVNATLDERTGVLGAARLAWTESLEKSREV